MKQVVLIGFFMAASFANAELPTFRCSVISYMDDLLFSQSITRDHKVVVDKSGAISTVDRWADETNHSYADAKAIFSVDEYNVIKIKINDELKDVSAIGKDKVSLIDGKSKLAFSCSDPSYKGN